jgi:hypothetical protein
VALKTPKIKIKSIPIRFDNTYSWARGKTIQYLIEVLEPEDGLSVSKSEGSQACCLPMVGGSLRVLWLLPPLKLIAMI